MDVFGGIMSGRLQVFKNIDFLRVVFAISIVVYHVFHGGKQAMGKLFVNVPEIAHMSSASVNGYLAVDMFFIMAGFFFFMRRIFL